MSCNDRKGREEGIEGIERGDGMVPSSLPNIAKIGPGIRPCEIKKFHSRPLRNGNDVCSRVSDTVTGCTSKRL